MMTIQMRFLAHTVLKQILLNPNSLVFPRLSRLKCSIKWQKFHWMEWKIRTVLVRWKLGILVSFRGMFWMLPMKHGREYHSSYMQLLQNMLIRNSSQP
ncbi:hypothetical protein AQUCO_06700041v1 [Aquilegia coerulea]|uniref:Uncharacterized protein n=1 Tax=Aquilegia coerulea TaxID=218851 RepID=A0A2G5CBT3_AQUCA|nr:hypothetical protein AQUCO_06700041v1 [Aquilegia coerulea]